MEDRVKSLEKNQEKQNKILYKVEASLNTIEKYITEAISNGKTTIKHEQQILSLEKRTKNYEDKQDKLNSEIASINLKIAMVSGWWAVAIFIINKLL